MIDSLAVCSGDGIDNFYSYVLGEGAQKGEMINLAESYNLSTYFTFLGDVQNPYKYMSSADLRVVTGFPNAIIEMMAAGTMAVITTPCTGDLDKLPKVIVTDGFSVVKLASYIKSLINTRPDNSKDYSNYASLIDADNYWNKIESQLCKK